MDPLQFSKSALRHETMKNASVTLVSGLIAMYLRMLLVYNLWHAPEYPAAAGIHGFSKTHLRVSVHTEESAVACTESAHCKVNVAGDGLRAEVHPQAQATKHARML